MKVEILEIITQYKFDHISSEQAVSELLDLFTVRKCDYCKDGKKAVCCESCLDDMINQTANTH